MILIVKNLTPSYFGPLILAKMSIKIILLGKDYFSSCWAKITFHLVGGKDNFSSCWAKITFQVSDFVTKYSVTSLKIALSFSFEFD